MAFKEENKKWVKTDAWRGYYQPSSAVIGASDTGLWEDSAYPSYEVNDELENFRTFLKHKGIGSRIKNEQSSNVFMTKRWVVVPSYDVEKAKQLAKQYLKEKETKYLHDAD